MKTTRRKQILVAGGAGFLGSHLCERLVGDGARVVCLDNFLTGSRENLRRLERESGFELIEHDVVEPLPPTLARRRFDRIYNLACAASPPLYQADPEHTLMTSVVGAARLLKLAEATGARFLLTSTSEVYGDPEVHPQTESYWGNVNCTGPRLDIRTLGEEILDDLLRPRESGALAQLATVWLLRRPEVTTVLIGASKVAQIDDIHAGLRQPPLAAAELAKIESILGQA